MKNYLVKNSMSSCLMMVGTLVLKSIQLIFRQISINLLIYIGPFIYFDNEGWAILLIAVPIHMGQVENSETSEFCFQLFFFRLFHFDLIPKIENSEKKFRAFRGFNLPRFRFFNQVSQI